MTARFGSEFQVNAPTFGEKYTPFITGLADGRFVVTWRDSGRFQSDDRGSSIKAQVFNADGSRSGQEIPVNPAATSNHYTPVVTTLADGRFAIAWFDVGNSASGPSDFDVRAQIFNADGSPVGADIVVNTTTLARQFEPSITALADGRFVVTWQDDSRTGGDTSNWAVRAQIFNPDGSHSGNEFLVNTSTAGTQGQPEVVALQNGGFVIAWKGLEDTLGHFTPAILAQMYNPDGSRLGGEFLVNTTPTRAEKELDVTELSSGRFVITWEDRDGVDGVFARIFNADGNPVGDEFRLNPNLVHADNEHSVTALADGGFVVTWATWAELYGDSSGSGVVARVYNADGSPRGSEFLVNTTTHEDQGETSVSALVDGRFVVTWQDGSPAGAGTSGNVIRGQIFDPRLAAVDLDGSSLGDDFVGTGFDDVMRGQLGNDRLVGRGGNDQLFGGPGSDRLLGGTGKDTLEGEDGDDFLQGGSGADVLNGGNGRDRAEYTNAGSAVRVDLQNTATSTGAAVGDQFLLIEDLFGSNFADTLLGDGGPNGIWGGNGNDRLVGRLGNDMLYGGNGNDLLEGGGQDDVLFGGKGTDTARGGDGNDTISGNPGADTLYGENGNDTLDGGDQNDILFGHTGADTLRGGNGDDILRGGEGGDALLGGGGRDTVHGGGGNDRISGGAGNDTLRGDLGADTINGEGGSDFAHGGDGNDELDGGTGSDRLLGGNHNDMIWGRGGNDMLWGENGRDVIEGGYGTDRLAGGDGNDVLFGGPGADTLIGGNGNDRLDGGNGNDRLIGGNGADVFVFSNGQDRVANFENTLPQEKVDLSGVASITGFYDLMNNGHVIQSSAHAVIRDFNGNTMTLLNVDIADLSAGDFLF